MKETITQKFIKDYKKWIKEIITKNNIKSDIDLEVAICKTLLDNRKHTLDDSSEILFELINDFIVKLDWNYIFNQYNTVLQCRTENRKENKMKEINEETKSVEYFWKQYIKENVNVCENMDARDPNELKELFVTYYNDATIQGDGSQVTYISDVIKMFLDRVDWAYLYENYVVN